MIELYATAIDTQKLEDVLVPYSISFLVTDNKIIIYDNFIEENVINEICKCCMVHHMKKYLNEENDLPSENGDNVSDAKSFYETYKLAENPNKAVYIGEVYALSKYELENRKHRDIAIIIQNDFANLTSSDALIIYATTCFAKRSKVGTTFNLLESNMAVISSEKIVRDFVGGKFNYFISKIKSIEKSELGEYVGTVDDKFMNDLHSAIDVLLGIKREKTINWNQIEMLSSVDITKLINISTSTLNEESKLNKILTEFGFNTDMPEFNVIKKAVLIYGEHINYTLDEIVYLICKNNMMLQDEVKRSITQAIKKRFNLKKSQALSFIRLVSRFLKRG